MLRSEHSESKDQIIFKTCAYCLKAKTSAKLILRPVIPLFKFTDFVVKRLLSVSLNRFFNKISWIIHNALNVSVGCNSTIK